MPQVFRGASGSGRAGGANARGKRLCAAATAAAAAAATGPRLRDLSEEEREARHAAITEAGEQRVAASRKQREAAAARQEEGAVERAAAVAANMTEYEANAKARNEALLACCGLVNAAAAFKKPKKGGAAGV